MTELDLFAGFCARREIAPLGAATPLLVPSFSSRGFPRVNELFSRLRHDLYGSCLLSAFDLAQGHLSVDLAQAADLVLLDSGGYETRPDCIDPLHGAPPCAAPWDEGRYRAMLQRTTPRGNLIVVSFDRYAPLAVQRAAALADFAQVPRAARNFLLKPPTDPGQLPVIDELATEQLAEFNVLGVTEKALGASALERCVTVLTLRAALRAAGLETPIHVFGAFTPRAVLAYFLCGADIFDGLSWLRFRYQSQGLLPLTDLSGDHNAWSRDELDLQMEGRVENLRTLRRWQRALREFAEHRDPAILRDGDATAIDTVLPLCIAARRALGEAH